MEKSIETIWSEGFSEKENLSAPKIDKLFKQKSKLITEKIKKTFWIYNYSILPVALIFGVGIAWAGHVILAFYTMFVLLAFFFLNKRIWRTFKNIDISTNTYQYLLAFRKSIKKMIRLYTNVYAIGAPVIIFPAYWLYFSKTGLLQKFITKTQTPYIILFLVVLALILSILTVLAYKLEIKIIYGRLIKKLNNTIADMEELMSEKK